MSRTWGIFSRITSSSVRIGAAMHASAEFFAPETRTVPTRGLPPRMTNLSISRLSGAAGFSLAHLPDSPVLSSVIGQFARMRFHEAAGQGPWRLAASEAVKGVRGRRGEIHP